MPDFKPYRRVSIAEMRPYTEGEVLSDRVSISHADREAGSPKPGDMIARNPKNHDDQWLVSADYFARNFVEMHPQAQPGLASIWDGLATRPLSEDAPAPSEAPAAA